MKKGLFLLWAVLLMLALFGCRGDKGAAEQYTITMRDEDWLYEALPSSAAAGDTVTVKIAKAYDVGYLFLVNGERVEMLDYTDTYWRFAFPMPEENVEINFKTYDGFLPDMHYAELIEAFWLQNLDAEYVSIREYYDAVESGAVIAMIDSCDYTANIWSEEVAGCRFVYGDGNCLQVFADETFYTLPEAYANGWLTEENVEKLFWRYFFTHPGLYTETEQGVNSAGSDPNKAEAEAPHIPITLECIEKTALDEVSCHRFVREESEYTQYLLIQPYETLTDVCVSFMDFVDDGFRSGEVLYTLETLMPDKPLVLGVVFYGDFTTYGLAFADAEGNLRQYLIYTSGRDGAVVLQEKES